MNALNNWYKQNRLRINTSKTKTMLITLRSSDISNKFIKDELIEQVKSLRYLGIVIDENLKWNVYLRDLCKYIPHKIYSLGELSKFLIPELLSTLYKCVIQPCIDYEISVWGNCPASYKLPLQRLQKRAARYVTGISDYELASGNILIKKLSWQTIDQRRDYFLTMNMFKCIRGIAPPRLSNEIEMYFVRHGLNTRNANSLNVVLPKTQRDLNQTSF